MNGLPTPRGKLTPNRPLNDLTWLRVGGPADYLLQPADAALSLIHISEPTRPD